MIEPGATFPAVPVKIIGSYGVRDTDSARALSSGIVVFFTLPGAFTPTCHNNHVPGYLDLAEDLKAAGVDQIVCGTVNDHHVVQAWFKSLGAPSAIQFLADGNGELAKALGLDRDMSAGGMGVRYNRAAIILDNGKIRAAFTEHSSGVVTSSGAPAILSVLRGN